jgi:hypothetical protein
LQHKFSKCRHWRSDNRKDFQIKYFDEYIEKLLPDEQDQNRCKIYKVYLTNSTALNQSGTIFLLFTPKVIKIHTQTLISELFSVEIGFRLRLLTENNSDRVSRKAC